MFQKNGTTMLEQLELPAEPVTYCRLCLARDDLVGLQEALGSIRQLVEVIFECTNVRLSPDAEPGCAICQGCQRSLAEFHHFRSQARRVDELIKTAKTATKVVTPTTVTAATTPGTDKTDSDQQLIRDQPAEPKPLEPSAPLVVSLNADRKRCAVEFLAVATTKRPRLKVPPTPTIIIGTTSSGGKHKCRYCPKSFKTATALTEHARTHHNRPHQCPNCLEQFQHAPSLARHIRNRTCFTFTKYRCRVCTESFLEQARWAEHIKIHADDFPYQCQECLSQFKHKATLRRHVNTVHLLQY